MMNNVPERKILLHPDLRKLKEENVEKFKIEVKKMLARSYPELEPVETVGDFIHCRRKRKFNK